MLENGASIILKILSSFTSSGTERCTQEAEAEPVQGAYP